MNRQERLRKKIGEARYTEALSDVVYFMSKQKGPVVSEDAWNRLQTVNIDARRLLAARMLDGTDDLVNEIVV